MPSYTLNKRYHRYIYVCIGIHTHILLCVYVRHIEKGKRPVTCLFSWMLLICIALAIAARILVSFAVCSAFVALLCMLFHLFLYWQHTCLHSFALPTVYQPLLRHLQHIASLRSRETDRRNLQVAVFPTFPSTFCLVCALFGAQTNAAGIWEKVIMKTRT